MTSCTFGKISCVIDFVATAVICVAVYGAWRSFTDSQYRQTRKLSFIYFKDTEKDISDWTDSDKKAGFRVVPNVKVSMPNATKVRVESGRLGTAPRPGDDIIYNLSETSPVLASFAFVQL